MRFLFVQVLLRLCLFQFFLLLDGILYPVPETLLFFFVPLYGIQDVLQGSAQAFFSFCLFS